MSMWQRMCAGAGVLTLAGMVCAPGVLAQARSDGSLRVNAIEARKVSDPDLRVSNPGDINENWFRVTVEYETSAPWLDDLDVTYYVLFEPDPRDSGLGATTSYVLLRGKTSYVNVKRGRHLSEVYLHPNTIERYGGVERVGVVFQTQGRLLGTGSEPSSRDGWWQQLAPKDGLILHPTQTPYNAVSPDHYEATKAAAAPGR